MAVQPDGKIIIGGFFTTVNGFARNNLARLNPDGTVDVDWNPNAVGAGVYALALSGTNLYVGGQFTSVGGQTQDNLAKLDLITGQSDPAWKPNPRTDGFFNGNGRVVSLAAFGGKVYAAGFFYQSTGDFSHAYLARFDAGGSGSVDGSWNPSPNNWVTQIAANSTNLFVAGNFTSIGGQSRTYLAKLDTVSGAADAVWNPGPNTTLNTLTLDGTNLYVGGGFTSVGGQSRNYVAQLSIYSGNANPGWNANASSVLNGNVVSLGVVGTNLFLAGSSTNVGGLACNTIAKVNTKTGAADASWSANPNQLNSVFCMAAAQGGGLLVGGTFQNFGGARSLGMAKLDLVSGVRDGFFQAQVEQPGSVFGLAQQPDGKIIVAGDFYLAGGLERPNLARINTDGSLDLGWSPKSGGRVNTVAVNGTNVFVGGEFTTMNGLPRNRIAKLNTGTPDAVDTNWNPNANDSVFVLAATNNDLFVGGRFLNIGGLSRAALAKLSATGTGAADANWNPNPTGTPYGDPTSYVHGMALVDTNLYVGGNFTFIGGLSRSSLAKLITTGTGAANNTFGGQINRLVSVIVADTANVYVGGQFFGPIGNHVAKFNAVNGAQDSSWNPGVSDPSGRFVVSGLGLNGTNLYVGGNFGNVGGYTRFGLAKVDALNAGAVDPTWSHDVGNTIGVEGSANVQAILVNNSDVYGGGNYFSIGGVTRGGFALLSVPHAPQLIQGTATNLFIFPNGADKTTTYFKITAVANGPLFKSDGVTAVNAGDFITTAEGAAGLVFVPGGTVTAVSALGSTTAAAGAASASLTMVTNPAPLFKFAANAYLIREGQGSLIVTVNKYGNGAANVNYSTADISAIGGIRYQPRSGTFLFSATDKVKNLSIVIADDLAVEPDQTFGVTLSGASAGASIAGPATSIVTIIDNDGVGASDSLTSTAAPAAPPAATGVLGVSLLPSNIGAQWRLLGELNWHNGGDTEAGLTTGNYSLEFRPLNGFLQPESITVPISASVTNQFLFFYTAITNLATGGLSVVIQPDDVATNGSSNLRGQWRQQGGATNWLNSGDLVSNLNAGSYTVEFKPVTGRITPAAQLIVVGGNANYGAVGTYYVGAATSALTPVVLPFSQTTTNPPYDYNGQLQTSAGFGSGFVVKQRVVLSAAHVLFDDQQLSYVATARWFFQRYRNQLEPPAQIPRGWYIFDGYAAQRKLDNSPGISTPESQDLDAAAIFFLEDAGRGGYGGYLSSDADNNEFLLSANNKFLAGYPLDGVSLTDQGKLFASTPANLNFTRLYTSVFATTNLQSYPGNSGGPLYVQSDINQFLPAAIYLGGSGETLVRAINSEVVDLINRAESSGNGGGNSTGGGVSSLAPGITAPAFGAGLITVNLSPNTNTTKNLGWRISGYSDTNYVTTQSATISLIGGASYPIEFKAAPGFITPSNRTVQLAVGGLVTVQGVYTPIRPVLKFSSLTNLNLTGATGAVYRVEFSTNLLNWSPLLTQTLTSGSVTITNLGPATNKARFYRTVLLP